MVDFKFGDEICHVANRFVNYENKIIFLQCKISQLLRNEEQAIGNTNRDRNMTPIASEAAGGIRREGASISDVRSEGRASSTYISQTEGEGENPNTIGDCLVHVYFVHFIA